MTIFEENDRVIDAHGTLQARLKRIVKRDTFGSEIGGDDGIRTHDLLSAIQALFRAELRPHLRGQLSYQKGESLQEVRRTRATGKRPGLEDGPDHVPGGDLGPECPGQTQVLP